MPVYDDDIVHCFVCGGKTPPDASLVLYSRKRKEDQPYYPFLDCHDPAPGAEPMAEDGSIQGCIVCFNFLQQQWLHFNKTRTSVNKRLYWLKRPPGCEIRQPVNIIELEEILSEQAREEGSFSGSEDEQPISPVVSRREKTPSPPPTDRTPRETVCFLCSIPTQKSHMQRISLEKNSETMKTIPETPVFSVLSRRKPPKGAVMDIPHTTLVCQNCFTDLCRKYPPEEQIEDVAGVNRQSDRAVNFKCYICKTHIPKTLKVIYSKQVHKGEPFYPFLLTVNLSVKDVKDLMNPVVYGYTYSCQRCHDELYKQWCVYETERMPLSKRKYEKQIEALFEPADDDSRPSMVVQERPESSEKFMECYICARSLDEKFKVFTHPASDEAKPFFPAIANIIPATRTQQLNQHASGGAAFVCRICDKNLKHQWQQYEKQGRLPSLNRWLRPYNVQEISCGQCAATVPSVNTVEASVAGRSIRENAIIYDNLTIICFDCEKGRPESPHVPQVSAPPISGIQNTMASISPPTSSFLHAGLPLQGLSHDVWSHLASAQVSQLSQLGLPQLYPLLPQLLAYQNPAGLVGLGHAQLTAAALSQQVAKAGQFAGQKRLSETEDQAETKKDRSDANDIAERIRQLEQKYEQLQNSSRKLAESVVSGEISKDDAKNLLDKMEE